MNEKDWIDEIIETTKKMDNAEMLSIFGACVWLVGLILYVVSYSLGLKYDSELLEIGFVLGIVLSLAGLAVWVYSYKKMIDLVFRISSETPRAPCPKCKKPLSYHADRDKWFCGHCEEWIQKPAGYS